MDSAFLKSMSTEELWKLHEELASTLAHKMAAERATLEERLRRITGLARVRRPYPKVLPKYQNPQNPAETWSGRGKQPRWLRAQLRSGKKLSNFLIAPSSTEKRRQMGATVISPAKLKKTPRL